MYNMKMTTHRPPQNVPEQFPEQVAGCGPSAPTNYDFPSA